MRAREGLGRGERGEGLCDVGVAWTGEQMFLEFDIDGMKNQSDTKTWAEK